MKNGFDELVVNASYRRLTEYYGSAVVPARVRKPRDKAAVESGVGLVTRGAMAPLRNHTFFDLVEAHIEQGAVLEYLGKQIGVVTAITGQKRYNVRVIGEANHADTTPMPMRKDALEGAARIMITLLDEAKRLGDPLVLTFGKLEPKPNIVNVVPGEVLFTVDTRHPNRGTLDFFAKWLEETIRAVAKEQNLKVEIENWMDEAPVPMDAELVELLSTICAERKVAHHVMHSGAGHDAQIIAPHVPTAMLFVPSVKGISHNPAEDTKMDDLLCGIDVLESVLYRLAY